MHFLKLSPVSGRPKSNVSCFNGLANDYILIYDQCQWLCQHWQWHLGAGSSPTRGCACERDESDDHILNILIKLIYKFSIIQ